MMANSEKICEFTAAVRGFHYYQRIWKPVENERLSCSRESGNVFDRFAIKITSKNDNIVGHLPMELSRITKFLLDRGACLHVELSSTHFRRSPLVQGGLEIACKVVVRMPATVKNHMIMDRYVELVKNRYTEPKDEVVLGSFLVSVPRPIVNAVKTNQKKKTLKRKSEKTVDIREMFKRNTQNQKRQSAKQKVIEID